MTAWVIAFIAGELLRPCACAIKWGPIIVIRQVFLMLVGKYWVESDPGILTGRD
jgi:hypothetical protein